MENAEYVKVSTEIASKYNITDNYLKWMILFACKNNVAEEVLDEILKKEKETDVIQAKIVAAVSGITDISEIKGIDDIRRIPDNKDYSEKIDTLINCILELSECNLALLEEFSEVKKVLNEVKSIDVDKNIYNIGFKILMKQNEVLNEFRENIKNDIEQAVLEIQYKTEQTEANKIYAHQAQLIPEEKEVGKENNNGIKGFFGRKRKNEIAGENDSGKLYTKNKEIESDSKINITENIHTAKTNDADKYTESIKKYNEVRERIANAPVNDIFDVFEIIRTGAFNNEQTKIIKNGINSGLSAVEILEYAKPENSAETMEQLLDFLEAVKIGQQVNNTKKTTIKTTDVSKTKAQKKNGNSSEEKAKDKKTANVEIALDKLDIDIDDSDDDFFK